MNKFLKLNWWIFGLVNIFSVLIYADDYVVEDIEFYQKGDYYAPYIKEGRQPGYLELHIAPANEEGISTNVLKIMDTTRLKGLLIVNRPDEECLDYEGIGWIQANENLKHSLTADFCADKIVIEIARDYPTADTYLKGLIRLVGKKAIVEIISTTGVSIDGASFRNIEELHIKSADEKHYDECDGDCARNIRINSKGIDADCPVFLYSQHVVVNGPIKIPHFNLNLITESACIFSKNAKAIELGGIDALCVDTFLNQGNLAMTDTFDVETGEFTNLPHWEQENWTEEMKVNFNGECYSRLLCEDLNGRTYDKKILGTGKIKSNHFRIIARRGNFLNEGIIQDTGGKEVESTIFAKELVLNQYRKYSTGKGHFKDGFKIAPSVLEFSGNAIIHSEVNRIVTDASIIRVKGNLFREAGKSIEDKAFKGSYFEDYLHKPDLLDEDNYKEVYFPTIIKVKGNFSDIARKDIRHEGSYYFVGENAYYEAGGDYILKGEKIKINDLEEIFKKIYDTIDKKDLERNKVSEKRDELIDQLINDLGN
ncbi:MAG: hypothetical protein C5B43_02370 [Verrucomicrobia bacterium]|nr:MAG: hypothetical protein C5B43_02370 [Verrucomicrobiota bacterium]